MMSGPSPYMASGSFVLQPELTVGDEELIDQEIIIEVNDGSVPIAVSSPFAIECTVDCGVAEPAGPGSVPVEGSIVGTLGTYSMLTFSDEKGFVVEGVNTTTALLPASVAAGAPGTTEVVDEFRLGFGFDLNDAFALLAPGESMYIPILFANETTAEIDEFGELVSFGQVGEYSNFGFAISSASFVAAPSNSALVTNLTAAVPLPAALPLLAFALAGLGFAGRRARRKA